MAPRPNRGTNQIRIIGGQWRGRKLPVPPGDQLRPTSDRIRETVFNWLQFQVPGARCLDLFAGSGALGFEAASRGAAQVVMLERDTKVVSHLRQQAHLLQAENIDIVPGDAISYLQGTATVFDVVFLDPPFGRGLLSQVCEQLEQGGWLAPAAAIYIEVEQGTTLELPPNWHLHRDKQAGQVHYALALRE